MPPRPIRFIIDPERSYKATLIEEKFKLTPRQQAKLAYEKYLDEFNLEGLIQK